MWVRKRLDIGWADLLYGLLSCFFRREKAERRLMGQWSHLEGAFACHSVRTALDLLLSALKLPAGCEVLISAVTVRGMVEVIEAHDLVAVPLDIEPGTLVPSPETLERAIAPASKVLIVAQLFGNRCALEDLWAIGRENGLITVEDNAQGFRGIPAQVVGCDLSFYSFGMIKAATALGGAMVVGTNRALIDRMRTLESGFGVLSRWSYCKRLAQVAVVMVVMLKPCFSLYLFILSILEQDRNAVLARRLRGFRSGALIPQLRNRPSTPLISLLARRHARFSKEQHVFMVQRGERLRTQIDDCLMVSGRDCPEHGYWVFVIETAHSSEIVNILESQGFDACQKGSLVVVEVPEGRKSVSTDSAETLLRQAVFLPFYTQLPKSEQDRMAKLICGMADSYGLRNDNPASGSQGSSSHAQ